RDAVRQSVTRTQRPVIPTLASPIRQSDAQRRLALIVDDLESRQSPNPPAAASAADYPGTPLPQSRRVTREIEIDLSIPGWASTGLWAMAGEAVDVTLPASCSGKGFRLLIGCHTDTLWHTTEWLRHPDISRSFPAKSGLNRISNPHGGLIYLDIPRAVEGSSPGNVRVQISGNAVEAPWYRLGKTTNDEWQRMRQAPAPWAELQCERIILTVPSEVVRSLADPRPLMEFWHNALGWYVELGVRPLDRRPQRIVADRQISCGWLHAGYPIMANIAVAPKMVNLAGLAHPEKDSEGAWGFWHELGHNHQRPEWTFSGATEVTCNLYSLYVEEKLRGNPPRHHPWLRSTAEKVRSYLAHPDFELWKKDPGLGLVFFVELQSAFGWEAFRKVFASYAKTPEHELPKTDDLKRDQWLIRFSQAVGRNLTSHFNKWGIPVSPTAIRAVSHLPKWEAERR
ncbi:MAG TPA: M60 family metallopeptidase, partial [Candidatus Ozemobacteraceae bacterium]|nr:M60 family metallopeptidase [Candidatus Ozemobacteraceae bacterium]